METLKRAVSRLASTYPFYKSARLLGLVGLLVVSTSLISDVLARDFADITSSSQSIPAAIFGMMTAAVGLAAVLTLFNGRAKSGDDLEREIASLNSAIDNIAPAGGRNIKPSAKSEDIRRVYDRAVGVGYVSTIFSRSRMNLKSELRKSRTLSAQALVFGIFFCFVAIGCTVYFIHTGASVISTQTSLYPFLVYYLPRLSVAVVAQVVALFFLNLSIINQRDARSIRNEVTNLDMREAGVVLSLLQDDAASSAIIADHLAKTERNFLLRRGERVMHEGDHYEKLSDQLAGLAKLIGAMRPSSDERA